MITALRAHDELPVAMRTRADLHLPVSALTLGSCRFVADCVLGANVVGHSAADRVNFVQRVGEERYATRSLRHDLQCAFGVPWVLVFFQYANGVNGWSIFGLKAPHGLLQTFTAFVIVAVGDYKNNFLLELRFFFQVVSGSYNRIIKRRTTASFNF